MYKTALFSACSTVALFFILSFNTHIIAEDGKRIGTIDKVNNSISEVFVRFSNKDEPIKMGDRMYVRLENSVVVMNASYPMQTFARCAIEPRHRSKIGSLKKGMPVFSYIKSVEEVQASPSPDNQTVQAGQTKNMGGVEFIYLPGGSFEMGVPRVNPGNVYLGEAPRHEVTVKGFWIAKYEITQKQYVAVIKNNPSKHIGENNPVDNISWNDAKAFCDAFSAQNKVKARLPYEAEWEYAARGGTSGRYYWGDTINQDYFWGGINSEKKTHPVGGKKPNNFGLYDMSGNVSEWVADWYDEKYYTASPKENPTGPATGTKKIFRGGSYISVDYHPSPLRVDIRGTESPATKEVGWAAFGIRLIVEQ